MQLFDDKNWDKFLDIIPVIKNELNEWKVVHFKIDDLAGDTIEHIAAHICTITDKWQGAAFVYSENEILMLAKTGEQFDKAQFSAEIEEQLKHYKCKITVQKMTFEGIAKVEVLLKNKMKLATPKLPFLQKRQQRTHRKIMMVEDDAMIRMMIAKTVAKYGEIIEMKNGKGALEKYILENPDAVFLDINLPHISGIKILERIMNVDPDAFIIMISANDSNEATYAALAQGARAFIPKPFTPQKIIEALASCPTL